MPWITRSAQITTLALSLLTLGLTTAPLSVVQAQPTYPSLFGRLPDQWEGNPAFNPPNSGKGNPEGRESASTRSGISCITDGKLTALVPASGVGGTAAEYPTFYWYLPQTTAREMEFRLLDKDNREIYKTKLAIERNQPSIMSLQLPSSATLLPLKIGEQYEWEVALICDPNERIKDEFVLGSIVRIDSASSRVAQRNTASFQDRLALYASSRPRLWYETLSAIVEQSRLRPNDPAVVNAWTKLLQSVGLNKIGSEPLIVQSAAKGYKFSVHSDIPAKQVPVK